MSPCLDPTFPGGLRAVVVEEWALFRQGVASVLAGVGLEIAGEARGAADGLMCLWASRPQLLVAGSPAHTRLPDLVAEAKKSYPELRVLALVPASEAGELRPILSSGADGVLARTASAEELEQAVRKVMAGERVLAAAAVSVLVGQVQPAQSEADHSLTAKELEVLGLLGKGLPNRDIAATLVVSTATVKSHLAHIYGKLGAANRQEAMAKAIALRLLG